MKRARNFRLARRARPTRFKLLRPRPVWQPIAMAWRKAPPVPAGPWPFGQPVRHHWNPHFGLHLHLAFAAHANVGRAASSRMRVERNVLAWNFMHRGVRDRLSRVVDHRVSHERTATATETKRVFRMHALPSESSPARGRGRVRPRRAATSAHFENGAIRRAARKYLTPHQAYRQLSAPQIPELVLVRVAARVPDRVFSPSTLVWRTEPEAITADTIERSLMAANIPTAASRAAPNAIEMQSANAVRANAAPTLDPALMDRVAEDVIGRVERRMRIERERRGG